MLVSTSLASVFRKVSLARLRNSLILFDAAILCRLGLLRTAIELFIPPSHDETILPPALINAPSWRRY